MAETPTGFQPDQAASIRADNPLTIYQSMRENARKGPDMDVGRFLTDLEDLDSTVAIAKLPALRDQILQAGQDPLLWLEVYTRTRDSVQSQSQQDIQKNLRLAHLLGMDQASTDPRRQAAVDQINQWKAQFQPDQEKDLVDPEAVQITIDQLRQLDYKHKQTATVYIPVVNHYGDEFEVLYLTLGQQLNLPPEQTYQAVVNARAEEEEAYERAVSHPFGSERRLREFLEKQPELFDRVFKGAPSDIKEAALTLQGISKEDDQSYHAQIEHLHNLILARFQTDQSVQEKDSSLYWQQEEAGGNFWQEIFGTEFPSIEDLKKAFILQNQSDIAFRKFREQDYNRVFGDWNNTLGQWGGIRVLGIERDDVVYVERPSPQSEKLLPPDAAAQVESLIAQIRKNWTDAQPEEESRWWKYSDLEQNLSDVLGTTLSKRKELGLAPVDQIRKLAEFDIQKLFRSMDPNQLKLLERMFQHADPALQEAFSRCRQLSIANYSISNSYLIEEAAGELEQIIDQQADLVSLRKDFRDQKEKSQKARQRIYFLLIPPAVNQTTTGEVVETYLASRKTDTAYQKSSNNLEAQRNRFFAGLADRAGLKLVEGEYPSYDSLTLAEKGWKDRLGERIRGKTA